MYVDVHQVSVWVYHPSSSYVYTSQLPEDLTVPLANELLSATAVNPKLSALTDACKYFVHAHDLKLRECRYIVAHP